MTEGHMQWLRSKGAPSEKVFLEKETLYGYLYAIVIPAASPKI